jgi:hypothetical protein
VLKKGLLLGSVDGPEAKIILKGGAHFKRVLLTLLEDAVLDFVSGSARVPLIR